MLQSVVMLLVANLTQAQAVDQYGDPLPRGAMMRLGTTRWRHSDHCTLAAFVGDGKSAITAGYDGLVAQWSVPDGRRMRAFGTKLGAIKDLTVSRDGRLVAVGNEFREVFVWETETGRQLWSTKARSITSPVIRFSPDSRHLAILGTVEDGILIHDAETGRQTNSIVDDRDNIEKICWSPDSSRIAAGMIHGMTSIYDASTGRRIIEMKQSEEILALDFSSNGKNLATVSGARPIFAERKQRLPPTIRVWNVETGEEQHKVEGKNAASEMVSVAYSSDGKRLAFTDRFEAQLFDVNNDGRLREQRTLRGSTWVDSLSFSRDGKYLVGGSDGVTPFLWDLSTQKEVIHETGHMDGIVSAAYLPTGKSLTSISTERRMITWDLATGMQQESTTGVNGIQSHRLSPSRLYIITAQSAPDFYFHVQDREKKTEVGPFKTVSPSFEYVIDEQRQQMVSVGNYGMHLWDLRTQKKLWTSQPDVPCHHVHYANDRTQILTWSWYSPDIRIIAANSGALIETMSTEGKTPADGAVSADGRSLVVPLINDHPVSPSNPNVIVVYDLSTRKEIRRMIRENCSPGCAKFCKRDKQILAGYSDGTVCLWDAATGGCLKSFASDSSVSEILVHPSERSFATVGANTSIVIWAIPD
ncbi:MAG TPA: WD40 repeat domain-containing protein [Schlesneria sp.]|jgi:WD40 repeat protein